MENGTLLNGPIVINKNNNINKIYSLFSNYFNNPILIKLKDENNISSYFAKVSTGLMTSQRYLIVNIEHDSNPIGKKSYLKNLKWNSLQTRSIKKNFDAPVFSYDSTNVLDKYILTVKERKLGNLDMTIYESQDMSKIEVYVFHTKKNNKFEYPEKAYLSNAIEEFKTLINIV